MAESYGMKISKEGHKVRDGRYLVNYNPYWDPEGPDKFYIKTFGDDLVLSSSDFLLKIKTVVSGYVDIPYANPGFSLSNTLTVSTGVSGVLNMKAFYSLDDTNWYPIDDRNPASPLPQLGVACNSLDGRVEAWAVDWTYGVASARRVYVRAILYYEKMD